VIIIRFVDVSVVDSVTFQNRFLPGNFNPPWLTYNFTARAESRPLLLPPPAESLSKVNEFNVKFAEIADLPEDIRRKLDVWQKIFASYLPLGWPITIPFRKVQCLGHKFQDTLLSTDAPLHFPNTLVEQTLKDIVLVVDLTTVPDRFNYSRETLKLEVSCSPSSSSQVDPSYKLPEIFCV
jgi:hypothetical protein